MPALSSRADLAADESIDTPRVLLVDDDEVNLLLTSIALRERGFLVTEAISGERALRAADRVHARRRRARRADAGHSTASPTCRELRGLPGFESMPVLMLTGLDDDASVKRAYEAGATDFFVKSTQWSLLDGAAAPPAARRRARCTSSSAASASSRARRSRAHGQLRVVARRARRPADLLVRGPAVLGLAAPGRRRQPAHAAAHDPARRTAGSWSTCCSARSSTARCSTATCRCTCPTAASASCTWRPSPSSTSTAT